MLTEMEFQHLLESLGLCVVVLLLALFLGWQADQKLDLDNDCLRDDEEEKR